MLKSSLKAFQKRLTNLTASNKSIFLNKISKSTDLCFHDFDFVHKDQTSFQLLENILFHKKSVRLLPFIDMVDKGNNPLSEALAKTFKKNNEIVTEIGAEELYIGYPFVEGCFANANPVRTPLVFFPVVLDIENVQGKPFWTLTRSKSNAPFFNKSFLLAYCHYNQLKFDERWYEFTFDDDFDDALAFRNFLYQTLKETNFSVNFNSDLFVNKLNSIDKKSIAEWQSEHANPMLKLQSRAVLGIFKQSENQLFNDYEAWIGAESEEASFEQFFDSKILSNKKPKEEDVIAPFEIDISQEQALKSVLEGKSMVVQGPPGTGKSQLICNMAACFAAKGKTVLIVSQKRAALDVVYQRLGRQQLQNFAVLIHDLKADHKKVFESIDEQIANIDKFESQNANFDTIALEREFLSVCRNIDNALEKLQDFKTALYKGTKFNISIKELYLLSDNVHVNPKYTEGLCGLDFLELEQNLILLGQLFDYHRILKNGISLHVERSDWKSFSIHDITLLKKAIENHNQFFSEHPYFNFSRWKQLSKMEDLEHKFDFLLAVDNALIEVLFSQKSQWKNIQKIIFSILSSSYENTLELDLELDSLKELKQQLETAKPYLKNFFSRVAFPILSKENKALQQIFKNKKVAFTLQNLEKIISEIDALLILINESKKLNKLLKISSLYLNIPLKTPPKPSPNGRAFEEIGSLEMPLNNINSILEISHKIDSYLHQMIDMEEYEFIYQSLQELKRNQITKGDFLNALAQFQRNSKSISHYFKASFFEKEHLNFDFENIENFVEYDKLKSSINTILFELFLELTNQLNDKNAVLDALKFTTFNAWIAALEQQHEALSKADSLALHHIIDELKQNMERKKLLSQKIVQLKLKEHTYKDLAYNRLKNRTTYRDLQHQTTKKRKLWSMKKLVQEFESEVYFLKPIWLCSPETASSIFEQKAIFDLVIFDEASQCFVEKGLPVMQRAKQCVVAGDSKQLQPFDLYSPRFETDSESPDLEIDSLLSFCERYLPTFFLKNHYRSQYQELIYFSNFHFYGNRLQVLPLKQNIQHVDCIEYVNVSGIWHQNTNVLEAERVVAEMKKYQNTVKKVGIVTFNAPQQNLILAMIQHKQYAENELLDIDFFVKNIENVQGDECDVLIFSLAYAPDKTGKMSMQFGLLNQQFGENRLNVAITRAREKIVIITSILPSQLQTEHLINDGVKMLKQFLEFAYQFANQKFEIEKQHFDAQSNNWYLASKLIANNKVLKPFYKNMADIIDGDQNLILTDDDFLFKNSVKEFFGYHPLHLSHKNWTYKFAFSRNFWSKKI